MYTFLSIQFLFVTELSKELGKEIMWPNIKHLWIQQLTDDIGQYDLKHLMNTQNRRLLFQSISRTMNESYQQDFSVTNLTLEQCQSEYRNQTYLLSRIHSGEFCDVTFDSILCWPPTPINETAVIKCFSELFSIKYDETRKYEIEIFIINNSLATNTAT